MDSITPLQQRCAMSLFTAGLAAAGCDYIVLPNMRADVLFDACTDVVRNCPDALNLVENAWITNGSVDVAAMSRPFSLLLKASASRILEKPRARKEKIDNILHPSDMLLARMSFVTSYWCLNEVKGDLTEYGFTTTSGN
jgi:hypothetical protein